MGEYECVLGYKSDSVLPKGDCWLANLIGHGSPPVTTALLRHCAGHSWSPCGLVGWIAQAGTTTTTTDTTDTTTCYDRESRRRAASRRVWLVCGVVWCCRWATSRGHGSPLSVRLPALLSTDGKPRRQSDDLSPLWSRLRPRDAMLVGLATAGCRTRQRRRQRRRRRRRPPPLMPSSSVASVRTSLSSTPGYQGVGTGGERVDAEQR